ncbi:uncharacterized protein LOC135844132 [Planococcus citri]|uniref:uncharacterized protein LOC135844132 n=1 Tax=Planococcus citri TaxID=170843 RepID=UPI0031F79BF3
MPFILHINRSKTKKMTQNIAIIIFFIITTTLIRSSTSIGKSWQRKPNKFDDLQDEMYRIDKSDLIRVLFENSSSPSHPNTSNQFCYITCPRGFGKSTNLRMIQSFAQIELDFRGNVKHFNETMARHIFTDLKINKYPEIVAEHMARYPVLYLSLARFARSSQTIDDVRLELMISLGKTLDPYPFFKNHAKLYGSERNSTSSRCSWKSMRFIGDLLDKNLTTEDLRQALLVVSRSLYQYFNSTKVIVLIDDYDDTALKSPILESTYITEAYRELNLILAEVFKGGSSFVRNVIMTGVSSLPYSIDDAMVDTLTHYAFLDNHIFTPYFGLTEADMNTSFTVYDISNQEQKAINGFYNGYWTCSTNGTKLFNTHSITRYLFNRFTTQKKPYPLKIYWTQDDLQGCISRFFRHPQFRQLTLDALKSGRLEYSIRKRQPGDAIRILEEFRDGDYRNENRTLTGILLTYYFEIGYLSYTSSLNVYTIPNLEVRKTLKKEARDFIADQTRDQ